VLDATTDRHPTVRPQQFHRSLEVVAPNIVDCRDFVGILFLFWGSGYPGWHPRIGSEAGGLEQRGDVMCVRVCVRGMHSRSGAVTVSDAGVHMGASGLC